jgi:hypothetical protein
VIVRVVRGDNVANEIVWRAISVTFPWGVVAAAVRIGEREYATGDSDTKAFAIVRPHTF